MPDTLTDLLFPAYGVRGALVEITSGIDAMLGARHYAPDVRRLVGQAIAAMPLLASHSKFEGRINLQFQGKGALQMLVAQIDRHLQVRGMAKAAADAQGDFETLMHDGTLAVMLDPDAGTQGYQAFVPTRGATLSRALEGYFAQSEQLPTMLRLALGPQRIAGILLQRLPEGSFDADGWDHLQILLDTLGEEEHGAIDGATLLRRLFHEEDLRVFEPRPLKLACRCDRGSIASLLLSLGESEIEPVLVEQGKVDVTCEFCGQQYLFMPDEVRQLYAAERSEPATATRH
ncbi:MAG: Hsp33 family molecular chaperone HslO [Nevskiaceae bacterium]|nr:MAG: Hsp33 family molecular chaperone HslO [Nevskiaceae bacterium]